METFKAIDLPSRKKSMAKAKAAGLKTSKFDNRAGGIWRRLIQYAKGKAPLPPVELEPVSFINLFLINSS